MARILIAEDNLQSQELMLYLLRAFGHTPEAASDGQELLDLLARDAEVDLLLLDVQMPVLDGYEVLARVKQHPDWCRLPTIAITALAMMGDREQALRAGFDGYISKPIDPEAFVGLVDSFLPPALRSTGPSWSDTGEDVSVEELGDEDATPWLERRADATGPIILAVDDLETNIELLRTILEPRGYQIMAASSVKEALVLAKQQTPELIISDIHMPGEGGFELLEAFKADATLGKVSVLFISCTTWDVESERQQAFRLGASQFLSRPTDPRILLEEVEKFLPHPA